MRTFSPSRLVGVSDNSFERGAAFADGTDEVRVSPFLDLATLGFGFWDAFPERLCFVMMIS